MATHVQDRSRGARAGAVAVVFSLCAVACAPSAPSAGGPTASASVSAAPSSVASAPIAEPSRAAPRVRWLYPRDGANGSVTSVAAGERVAYGFGANGLVARRRAGESWTQVESELGLDVESAAVLPNGHVIAVAGPADARVLVRSTDEGRTFEVMAKSRKRDPMAFVVEREPEIVIATGRGVILRSNDEGATLAPYAELATSVLTMHVDVSGAIYLGGEHGRLFVSRTRKATWDRLDAGTTDAIHAIWSFGDEVLIGGGHYAGMGVSQGFVRASRDRGKTFRAVAGVDGQVTALLGVGKATFAVAAGALLRREAGAFAPAVPPAQRFWPVRQLVGDASAFTAFGDAGARFVSLDGGRSFAARDVGEGDNLAAVVALDERRLVAVGIATISGKDRLPGSQEYKGVVLRSDNGGATWSRKVIDGTTSLTGICVRGDRLVAVAFMGALLESTDGGVTFTPVPPGSVEACAAPDEAEVVTLADGLSVRIVAGVLEWSYDRKTWKPKRIGAGALGAMARVPGAGATGERIVLVGDAGAIVSVASDAP